MSLIKRWFGRSKDEVWRQLSDELGADYVEGGFCRSDKVEVAHGDWRIVLDSYAVSTGKVVLVYTRLRSEYVNPSGFHFSVSRAGIFSEFAKMLGMQDITVNHDAFDEAYIIKGNDEDKVRRLFDNARIRELIMLQPDVNFALRSTGIFSSSKLPEGTDELVFTAGGIIKDKERLKLLYDLLAETLDELGDMDGRS